MKYLEFVLSASTAVLLFLCVCAVYALFAEIFRALRNREAREGLTFNGFLRRWWIALFGKGDKKTPVRAAIVGLVVVLGIVNIVLRETLPTNTFGGFNESLGYSEKYDAVLSVNARDYGQDSALPCIVSITRYEGDYHLDYIQLPHNKYIEPYETLDGTLAHDTPIDITVNTALSSFDCELTIGAPATDTSYARMENATCQHAYFFGSRDSDKYHFSDCPHVAQIASDDLIWFSSDREAELYEYAMCDACENWEG